MLQNMLKSFSIFMLPSVVIRDGIIWYLQNKKHNCKPRFGAAFRVD